jgi:hypothetical protein
VTDPLDRPWQDIRSILAAAASTPASEKTDATERPPLTRAQKWLVGVVSGFVTIIAGIGFAGSYSAVTKLAAAKGFGWFAWAFPAGVDSGIGGFLALDLLLTWLRIPYPLLRQVAWFLTAATICFNASASWGDPVAVGMHATIPLLFITAVEGARHAVGRIADITADRHMESPPLIRWFIAPWPTFRIWRRMRLWQISSYSEVIVLERDRRILRTRLQRRYGQQWRTVASERAQLALELSRFGVPIRDTLAAPLADIDPDNTPALPVQAPRDSPGQQAPDNAGTTVPISADIPDIPSPDTPADATPDSNVVPMTAPRPSSRTSRPPTRTTTTGQGGATLSGHVRDSIASGITDTDTILASARDKFGTDTKRETVRRLVNRHAPDAEDNDPTDESLTGS